ncbi:related to helicases of the Snf2/Rad54 family [Phialocephala subalpina]|uniref:Related to helicases of the Snf2/Rad54 family n=1 Tax=Phialocephala subalpina TaxID=576137 RepID=A0A1L7WDH0_9HELO|nr:related to helicases of the Snf2/Rad54 family [Phialocephala subalpina]
MAFNDGATQPTLLVDNSPPPKRQKTASGYNSTSTSANNTGAYNSDNDSGDDLLADFIPDTPGNGYQTQPTQILPRAANATSSPPPTPKTVVQVPASSPFSGRDSEPRPPHNVSTPTQQKSSLPPRCLAMSMAPAGTAYRPPAGIVAKPPVKVYTIPDDDDSRPTYVGDSSDDESGLANIAPTKFISRSANSSFGGSPSKDAQNTSNGQAKFNAVMNNSVYKGPASGKANAKASQLQMRPERAQAIVDIGMDDVDEKMKRLITQFRGILPHVPVLTAQNMITESKGNVQDAVDKYMNAQEKQPEIIVIEDEIETPQKKPELQMKRGLTGPIASIRERYSTQAAPKPQAAVAEAPKKRKLVQGRKHPSSPATPQVSSPLKPQLPDIEDDYDSDSGLASGQEEEEDNPELEDRVLKFLNTCTLKDAIDLTSLSQHELEIMIAARPFKTLDAARVVENQKTTKGGRKSARAPIGDKIVQKCIDMFEAFDAITTLETTCEELGRPIGEEMKEWGFDVFGASKTGELELTSLDDDLQRDSGLGSPSSGPASNAGDDDIKTPVVKRKKNVEFLKKPDMMAEDCVLKDYQVVGLNWLALMYRHNLSCILADDMGLGKTCQVISLLTHLVETGHTGPHVVICPGSTLENWLREFRKFSPDLSIVVYHGSQPERAEAAEDYLERRDVINVVVTTYDMAWKKEDNKFLRRMEADVIVYDEGHMLKNTKAQRYQGMIKIPANFRLLLTGTPLQNNLRELVAILAFILPDVFATLHDQLDFIFKVKATTHDKDHAALLSKQRIDRARSILTPFVLHCKLHPAQKEIYDSFMEQARERARIRVEGGVVPKADENNPLMQLRKAAIHPLLFRRHFTESKIKQMADILRKRETQYFPSSQKLEHLLGEMRLMSDFWLHTWCEIYPCIRKFDIPDLAWMDSGKVETMSKLVKSYKENGDRVLIFSQFALVLDILEAVLNSSGIVFTRIDGSTKIDERQTKIDEFRDDKSITAFLLTTKAGGTGINLMYANKVIIFDSSFNPQDDKQAENRAHRVGQKKQVEVVRLVTRDTVEEQIHQLGESKLMLDGRVAGEEASDEAGEQAISKMLLDGTGTSNGTEETGAEASKEAEPEPKSSQGKLPTRKKASILDMLTTKKENEKPSGSRSTKESLATIDDDGEEMLV